MKVIHRFDENLWSKTSDLIKNIHRAGMANEQAKISEILNKYGLDIKAASKEQVEELTLFINCAIIDLNLQNINMNMPEYGLTNKIFILYCALKSNAMEIINVATNELEIYLLNIESKELGYWS